MAVLARLTTVWSVVIIPNMRAELLLRERIELSEAEFVERVVWRVPTPLRGSLHSFKYRLALISEDVCVLRYDNEAGKGDHKHVAGREERYHFVDLATLMADFWADAARWRDKR